MIYFDNAATTCVFPEVVEAMQDAMQVTYGNPSAKHMKGIEEQNQTIQRSLEQQWQIAAKESTLLRQR